jgi:radial spoke head protein 9
MELFNLESGLPKVATAGAVLSPQEMTIVKAGLATLKMQEKCDEVYLWGKILGTQQDYFIAYKMGSPDEFDFPAKAFYYATMDLGFQAMPRITEEMADKIIELAIDKPFTGVPNSIIPESDLTEADRLAQVVAEIDFDTAVVPNGAYALNEAHAVKFSSDFKGLSMSDASSITQYVHFRPPTSVASLRTLAKSDTEFLSQKFLDPLDADLPKGCWSIRQDTSTAMVNIRSLLWPGYVAYSVPTTPQHGGLYIGYGQKNRDLSFIL